MQPCPICWRESNDLYPLEGLGDICADHKPDAVADFLDRMSLALVSAEGSAS